MNRLQRIGLIAALCALVGLGASAASSAPGKAAKANASSPFHTILTELHATKHLLSLANHDYAGNRAKAHAEVGKAIHLLQTHPYHHHHVARTGGGKGLPAIREAQQISDAQMLQAGQNLQTILTQLAALQTTPLAHPNIANAGASLQLAIGHIQTGLKVSPLNK
jgi:hypothetical protein